MRTSASQFQLLVEFMERNGDLSKPTEGPQGRMTNVQLWSQLTNMLNADATGDTKTVDKWRKVWSDMKNNTKKKAARIHRHASGTGGGPSSRLELTELEQRVMNIIGPQAATGIIQVGEIGLDQDPPSRIEISEVEVQESTDGTVAFWSQVVDTNEANQLPPPAYMEPSPAQVPIDHPSPTVDDAQPMPEAPPIPTPLPPTPRRRRRRLLQNVSSPNHRRTRTQTQSELARQAFVASNNEWRVFQRESERERIGLRERALDQQDRWLDLFGQFIALGNRIVDIFRNN